MENSSLAELYGIMAGDGCLSNTGAGFNSGKKYWIYICGHKVDDRSHYDYIKSLFKEVFNKETNIGERKKENAIFIRFSDKKIFHDFVNLGFPVGKKYSKLGIPSWITENNINLVPFLRGLFDTDGSFVLSKQHKEKPYYPRIEVCTKSEYLAKQTKEALDKLGIGCSLNKKLAYFRLEVAGRSSCDKWMNIIGTKNKKHEVKYLNNKFPN